MELDHGVAPRHARDTVFRIDRQPRRRDADNEGTPAPASRIFRFIEELRRRKVCRALTMYAVGLWLISQVVDLAYQQLGLPDWTLRFVLIIGLAGLPVALLLSWLLDLNPQGVVLDAGSGAPAGGALTAKSTFGIDCFLLLVAIAIAAQLAWASVSRPEAGLMPAYERISVAPFRVGPGQDALAVSQGLAAELQHELASRAGFRVVAPREPFSAENCLTLTGSVSTDEATIRVTAALIHNESMEVVWTGVIRKERSASLVTVADIASDLVSTLQVQAARLQEVRHEG